MHGRIARGSSVARARAGARSLTPGADWAGVELRARPTYVRDASGRTLTLEPGTLETGVELSMIVLAWTTVRGSLLADAITRQFDERVGIVRVLGNSASACLLTSCSSPRVMSQPGDWASTVNTMY
jgi:hypothetical protein